MAETTPLSRRKMGASPTAEEYAGADAEEGNSDETTTDNEEDNPDHQDGGEVNPARSLPDPMVHVTVTTTGAAQRDKKVECVGLVLGPAFGLGTWLLLQAAEPEGMGAEAQRLTGVTLLMATWWMTEAVPLGITALLPLALFPLLDIMASADVASSYSTPLMWLFFGGFQLAFAIERTGLHKRAALGVMRTLGTRPHFLILGVMLAVGCLSMFLSNTSTTLMILPVVRAMVDGLKADGGEDMENCAKALLLGVAYGATSGGIATIIGTPPNGVLVLMAEKFNFDISFGTWLGFAMPLSLIFMVMIWLYLVFHFGVSRKDLRDNHPVKLQLRKAQPKWSEAEMAVLAVFALTVLAWVLRRYIVEWVGIGKGRFEDDTIAILVVASLFLVRAKQGKNSQEGEDDGERKPLMNWEHVMKTPWQILLLFGGGFALASGFVSTGLSHWLGQQLAAAGNIPTPVLVGFTVLMVTFLTEITSNTATANVLLPILGELACQLDVHPAVLMVPATLACSCAFMLPVATAPNMIVMSTGDLKVSDMMKAGVGINFATTVIITIWFYTWGRLFFHEGADPGVCDAAPSA